MGQWMDGTVMDDAEMLSGVDLSQWTALQSYQEKCPMKARQYGPSILLPKVTCGPLPLLLHMSMCREPSA